MKCSEIYEKYGKHEINLPFRDCYFCENIEDCPHPTVDEFGQPICPEECVRKEEIDINKRIR